MKKIFRTITALGLACLALTSCNKFLEVNPEGEVFDADMFSSEEGYEDALYGIYSEIGTGEFLYAGYLLWTPEALSHNVTCTDYTLGIMQNGIWKGTSNDVPDKIWGKAYTAINHLNNILGHIETGGDNEFRHTPIFKGEALALRALLHFELLRLYGAPLWASDSQKAEAIPYVTSYSFTIAPFLSVEEAYRRIIRDLEEAEACLSEDATLLPAERHYSATGFYDARITHMNLYAVQALLARVYWSMDDMANAERYALKVIDSGKFTFRPKSAFVNPVHGALDFNETVFGLYSTDFQTRNRAKYQLGTTSSGGLFLAADWLQLYEDGSSDLGRDDRLAWFNEVDERIVKLVHSSYYDGTAFSGDAILGANILRIPEMYYIVAEANIATDPQKAAEYFNAVRSSRSLTPVDPAETPVTAEMLFNERRKEYYGEGLTWHEMKKRGMDIPLASGSYLPGDSPDTYTMPVPDEEYERRQNLDN